MVRKLIKEFMLTNKGFSIAIKESHEKVKPPFHTRIVTKAHIYVRFRHYSILYKIDIYKEE
jgi:hypothetical protein